MGIIKPVTGENCNLNTNTYNLGQVPINDITHSVSQCPEDTPFITTRRTVNRWANYDHLGDDQAISASTWTTIVNNGLNTQSTEEYIGRYSKLYDVDTGSFYFRDLALGDQVDIRFVFSYTPIQNNPSLKARLLFNAKDEEGNDLFSFDLVKGLPSLNLGAGIRYENADNFTFFVGSDSIRFADVFFQVFSDSSGDVGVGGLYISVTGKQ